MPTVPTSFVPQVAPQNAATVGQVESPPVAVAENLAAQQQVRFGQTMLASGTQAFRLGSAIQDEIDEANTKAADIAFLQRATELMRGQNGYLRTSGQDAEAKYEETAQALSSAAQTALGGLQNPTQKKMFEPVLARNMMMFQTQALDHRDQEVKKFAANESNARARQYASLAIDNFETREDPNGVFEVNRLIAEREVQQAAIRMGIPKTSAQMTALEQKLNTEITVGVVNRLMLDNRFDEAYDWVRVQEDLKRLDADTGERLLASVDANRDRFLIDEYASNIQNFGRVGRKDDNENNVLHAPESLRDALEEASTIEDPEIRKGVEVALRTRYSQAAALQQAEYNAHVDRVEQFLAVPGNDVFKLPPEWFGALTPTDRARLLAAQRKEDSLDVMEELARNPALLTREYVEKQRGKLTRETYLKLLNDANSPERVIAATIDEDQLYTTLIANKLYKLADPTTDADKRTKRQLREAVKRQIDAAQDGRPLNRTEKQRVLDQTIIQFTEQVYEPDWIFDNLIMAGTMTPEQRETAYVMIGKEQVQLRAIPPAWIATTAIPAFRDAGEDAPTLKQIANLWILQGKPTR